MHEFLAEKLKDIYDNDRINSILAGLSCKRKTCFRVNNLKSRVDETEKVLKDQGINYKRFTNFNSVFILDAGSEDLLSKLDIYKDGMIYLQSISSMLPVYLLDPKTGENILDMCAAPGGKTTLIQDVADNKVNLTAVELHKDRFERLKFNVNLQGVNVYLLNINALDLDNCLKFDKILLDAPCSGSGILDLSDENYQKYFTSVLIDKCVKTQKKLISKASHLLKKSGILVYSTCSLLKEENEDVINFALKNGFRLDEKALHDFTLKLGFDKLTDNFEINENSIKIYPSDTFEGFFVTRFIKV